MAKESVIAADFIPEELQKIEYQIGMKQALIARNKEALKELQMESDRLWAELSVLENDKYRLLTGRNI